MKDEIIKIRLDQRVMELTGFGREFCKELIRNGSVKVNDKPMFKPGEKIDKETPCEVAMPATKYVSRGGYKLEKALDFFGIDLNGKTCIDVGASTGGFTDCMLQRGAVKVYAVDNGKAQLAEALLKDARVASFEGVNINDMGNAPEKADFIAVDVSFVSISKIIAAVCGLLKSEAGLVLLIKPQFEAGRENVSKAGIVRSRKARADVVDRIRKLAAASGLQVCGLTESPIKGQDGNIEYLMYCKSINN